MRGPTGLCPDCGHPWDAHYVLLLPSGRWSGGCDDDDDSGHETGICACLNQWRPFRDLLRHREREKRVYDPNQYEDPEPEDEPDDT